jgi:predicted amidohydrolase
MPRSVRLAACQPPATQLRQQTERLLAEVSQIAAGGRMVVALPLIGQRGASACNTTVLLGRDGREVGAYDSRIAAIRVHLTEMERVDWGLTPGNSFGTFELDFGRVGIMTCYDVCFPECARALALGGAEIILFPALQRGYTEDIIALQVRARAYDNSVYIVRSSYGTPAEELWRPGLMVGKSCIVAPDGTIVADLGRRTGMVYADVALDAVEIAERSFGGQIGPRRNMQLADRRPDAYGSLCEPKP